MSETATTATQYQVVVQLPCKDAARTAEVIKRHTNMRLVDIFRVLQSGHPYRMPFQFTREEADRIAQELRQAGTGAQVLGPDGQPIT